MSTLDISEDQVVFASVAWLARNAEVTKAVSEKVDELNTRAFEKAADHNLVFCVTADEAMALKCMEVAAAWVMTSAHDALEAAES